MGPKRIRLDPGLDVRKPLQLARMYEIQEFCTAQGYFELRPPRWNSQRSTWDAQ